MKKFARRIVDSLSKKLSSLSDEEKLLILIAFICVSFPVWGPWLLFERTIGLVKGYRERRKGRS